MRLYVYCTGHLSQQFLTVLFPSMFSQFPKPLRANAISGVDERNTATINQTPASGYPHERLPCPAPEVVINGMSCLQST